MSYEGESKKDDTEDAQDEIWCVAREREDISSICSGFLERFGEFEEQENQPIDDNSSIAGIWIGGRKAGVDIAIIGYGTATHVELDKLDRKGGFIVGLKTSLEHKNDKTEAEKTELDR